MTMQLMMTRANFLFTFVLFLARPLSVVHGQHKPNSDRGQWMSSATPKSSTCGFYCRRPDLLREQFLEGVLRFKREATRKFINYDRSPSSKLTSECPQFIGKMGVPSFNSPITEDFQTPIEMESININSLTKCLQRSERIVNTLSNLNVLVTSCCFPECFHEIKLRARAGHNILLNITSFTVPGEDVLTEKSSSFCTSLLQVGVERKTDGVDFYLLASLCDDTEPPVVFVPHREVLLRYYPITKQFCEVNIGFNITISPCQRHSVTHACQQMRHFQVDENEGFIISPGFDENIPYPNNIKCSKKIAVPPNKSIKITMDTHFLGDGDSLILIPKNSKYLHFPENITYTGNRGMLQPTILPSNECTVTFFSNDVAPGFGFNLTYTTVDANDFLPMYPNTSLNCSHLDSIPDSWKCDFQQMCINGEDERNCTYRHDSCGANGYYYKHHCYYVIEDFHDSTWMEAKDFCEREYNAYIMSINTVGERRFIDKLWLTHDLKFSFLGLKRMKGKNQGYSRLWQWSDGRTGFYLPTELRHESWTMCSVFTNFFFAISCLERWIQISLICETNLKADEDDADVVVPFIKNPSRQYDNIFHNYSFECLSGEYIGQDLVCNEKKDCFDGSDEGNKLCENVNERETMFKCLSRWYVPYTFVCNGVSDCPDNSDENFCIRPNPSSLPDGKVMCRHGMVIDKNKWCDGRYDCMDLSDEDDCRVCSENAFICPLFQCFPKLWEDDNEIDCPIRLLQGDHVSENRFKSHFVQSVEPPGIVFPDGYGKVSIEKLHEECPNTHFQCDEGFCIPVYLLCNGYYDCPYGEDEKLSVCEDQCKGLYKCKSFVICIHASQLCNSVYECPMKDDEMMCSFNELYCPAGCKCIRSELFCTEIHNFNESIHISYLSVSSDNFDFTDLDKIQSTSLIVLNISGNAVKEIGPNHLHFYNLLTLDASNNEIEVIHNDSFEHCWRLETLLLAWNNIKGPQFMFLRNARSIRTLDLSHNINPELGVDCFENVRRLQKLLLRNMGISRIYRGAFAGLTSLRELDLRGNEITVFSDSIFRDQQNLFLLKTDNFRLCCYTVVPTTIDEDRCIAPIEGVSSCTDLLRSTFLCASLWVMATLAISGNIGTIVYRIFFDNCQPIKIRIIMTCLAASDLLMGLYLVIIGGADAAYRNYYITYEKEWKSSTACRVSGFICLLSKEVSTMFILLATLDRLLVIIFPLHKKFHLTSRSASVASVAVWLIGLSLASFPLLSSFQHSNLYSQISTGVPLPISTHRYPGFVFTYAVFIILNSFIFILISVGQISIYLSAKQKDGDVQMTESRIIQHTTVTKNLTWVVISCCLCWFAFTVIGILAVFGVAIPVDVYVFTTVVLFPVNSALNPFIYTLNAACVIVREKNVSNQ